jgi:MFS family permease
MRAPAGRGRGRRLATLATILFLTFLDNTIVSVILADMQTTLHPGVSGLQWIVNGYMLAFAALMLTGGTLGDLLGRKKVMLSGVAVFCAGSVAAALAPTTSVLIGSRVVMGIGAAASEPGTLSMIRHIYPERGPRARALGVWVWPWGRSWVASWWGTAGGGPCSGSTWASALRRWRPGSCCCPRTPIRKDDGSTCRA